MTELSAINFAMADSVRGGYFWHRKARNEGMRIFIHTDMEGASGIGAGCVNGVEVVKPHSPHYEEGRRCLLADIHAAIDGALDGGATHITVLDNHGGGDNFTAEDLRGRAEYDPRTNGNWWGSLDGNYDATFFIGAHAMAGTHGAFLDHTQSTAEFFDWRINGRSVGEMAQWGMVAAEFGVPLIMMSGDEAACVEARTFFQPIETAAVKRGIQRMKAECLLADIAYGTIRMAARNAMKLIGTTKPLTLHRPIEFEITCTNSGIADNLTTGDIERMGARTVRWVRDSAFGLFPWYAPMDRAGRSL